MGDRQVGGIVVKGDPADNSGRQFGGVGQFDKLVADPLVQRQEWVVGTVVGGADRQVSGVVTEVDRQRGTGRQHLRIGQLGESERLGLRISDLAKARQFGSLQVNHRCLLLFSEMKPCARIHTVHLRPVAPP